MLITICIGGSLEKASDTVELVDVTPAMASVLAPKDERELVCRHELEQGRKTSFEANCRSNLRTSGTSHHRRQAVFHHHVGLLQAQDGGHH
jgi:hypothetical protein